MYISMPATKILAYILTHTSSQSRLYVEFTTNTIIATAFGQTAGESNDIISIANEFITAFLDSMSNGAEEVPVILCKLTIEESNTRSSICIRELVILYDLQG